MYGRSELMCRGGTWQYETPTCIGSEKQDLYINFKYFCYIFFFTICNRSCGYVFTGVFHSVHRGGRHGRGHAWNGVCVARGPCVAGATHGRGHAWQDGCLAGGMCGRGGVCVRGACIVGGKRDCLCSRQYASYWNAFLFT